MHLKEKFDNYATVENAVTVSVRMTNSMKVERFFNSQDPTQVR